jgi:hypothetical protein
MITLYMTLYWNWNKSTNKMQQFHSFITWRSCVARTCFGRLSAHTQEHTTALRASGFTVGAWRLECCWSWYGRLCMYGILVDLFESYDDAWTCERQTVLKILPEYCEEYAVTCILNRWICSAATMVQATRNLLGLVSRKQLNVFVKSS